jgi:hypothetical protein
MGARLEPFVNFFENLEVGGGRFVLRVAGMDVDDGRPGLLAAHPGLDDLCRRDRNMGRFLFGGQ